MIDRQQAMINDRHRPRQRVNLSNENLSNRIPDDSIIEDVDDKAVYAVFVSYVEVYNEKIYDLMDTDTRDIGRTK